MFLKSKLFHDSYLMSALFSGPHTPQLSSLAGRDSQSLYDVISFLTWRMCISKIFKWKMSVAYYSYVKQVIFRRKIFSRCQDSNHIHPSCRATTKTASIFLACSLLIFHSFLNFFVSFFPSCIFPFFDGYAKFTINFLKYIFNNCWLL